MTRFRPGIVGTIMGKFLKAAALASVALATPATAADWDSVAGWDVYEVGATQCVIGRAFAQADLTFGIIMSVDGEVRVFATGAGWPARAGESVDAMVAFDGKALVQGPSVGIEQQRNRGFVAAGDAAMLEGFASARQLTVRAGSSVHKEGLPLTGSAAALAQGRRCVSNLREERGAGMAAPVFAQPAQRAPAPYVRARPMTAAVRAPAVQTLASRATPRVSLASLLGDSDYPAAALRAGHEGSTTVRLAIDSRGAVADCDIARSSGSDALDDETCRVFMRKGRFSPARDTAGRPVVSFAQQTVRWQLPD